jgi:hypothetical protein
MKDMELDMLFLMWEMEPLTLRVHKRHLVEAV